MVFVCIQICYNFLQNNSNDFIIKYQCKNTITYIEFLSLKNSLFCALPYSRTRYHPVGLAINEAKTKYIRTGPKVLDKQDDHVDIGYHI